LSPLSPLSSSSAQHPIKTNNINNDTVNTTAFSNILSSDNNIMKNFLDNNNLALSSHKSENVVINDNDNDNDNANADADTDTDTDTDTDEDEDEDENEIKTENNYSHSENDKYTDEEIDTALDSAIDTSIINSNIYSSESNDNSTNGSMPDNYIIIKNKKSSMKNISKSILDMLKHNVHGSSTTNINNI
jgi:hypothetical protein